MSKYNVKLVSSTFNTSILPVIVATLLVPPIVNVIPFSNVCTAPITQSPAPSEPPPDVIVGLTAEAFIPIPLTVDTLLITPYLSVTAIVA